jgi:hypothetical protein
MKFTQNGTLLVLVLLVFALCNSPKRRLPTVAYNKITNSCKELNGFDLHIYYFDGDCSLCIAKLLEQEDKVKNEKDVRAVFIAKTRNAATLEYNLQDKNIKSCVIIDKGEEYASFFKLNQIVLVNKQMEMKEMSYE